MKTFASQTIDGSFVTGQEQPALGMGPNVLSVPRQNIGGIVLRINGDGDESHIVFSSEHLL
jgi:hypothetical protein